MEIFTKKQAKEKIAKLVKRFENLSSSAFKRYNEANTRKDFILPLFHALGWDVHNERIDNEVVEEETTISGRIDYSFRINNITHFLLEAKAIPKDLDKEKWARQAVEYGWNKGVAWVVLTDFEGLKVFNSEWKRDQPRANIDLSYKEYFDKFEKLWLLSKQSFKTNKLDKLLGEFGITAKRINVNERLAEDLVNWRNTLNKNLKQWNIKYKTSVIEEAVQRILDRLVFIRVLEDRNIEDKLLWQAFQKWRVNNYRPYNFIKALIPIFKKFDKKYNSNLFQKHLCEDLDTEGDPFQRIVPQLYASREEGVKYRFDAIDADVLGSVYEQYLGTVQQREGDKSKRKKQGIYYTPTYIVDYIVQNTLGRLLKDTSLLGEKENIKVLDPACGSGSFLIRAFEVLDGHLCQTRNHDPKDHMQTALRRHTILRDNIYGIDLDEQAIEIARLNLLLKALVPNHKLPMLTNHMKVGNSLISDKKITDKAFDWQREFSEVFKGKNPGFDIIIGNPPYIRSRNIKTKERKYYPSVFKSAFRTFDVYLFFLEKSLGLLKNKGIMGFIIPYSFLNQPYASRLRKILIENCNILEIVDLSLSKVFQEAQVRNCIIICQKDSKSSKLAIIRPKGNKLKTVTKINQRSFLKNLDYMFKIELEGNVKNLIFKIEEKAIPLSKIVYISKGIEVYERGSGRTKNDFIFSGRESRKYKPYFEAKEISRYRLDWKGRYIFYQPKKHCSGKFPGLFENNKILMKRIVGDRRLSCYLDREDYYVENTLICCLPKKNLKERFNFEESDYRLSEKYKLPFLLAILNSKMMTFYFKNKFGDKLQIYNRAVGLLPIKIIEFSNIKEKEKYRLLMSSAQRMLNLNKRLQKISEDTDRWYNLKNKIEKLDKKIDQMVYKLYSLKPGEIGIVEKNTNAKKKGK